MSILGALGVREDMQNIIEAAEEAPPAADIPPPTPPPIGRWRPGVATGAPVIYSVGQGGIFFGVTCSIMLNQCSINAPSMLNQRNARVLHCNLQCIKH